MGLFLHVHVKISDDRLQDSGECERLFDECGAEIWGFEDPGKFSPDYFYIEKMINCIGE